MGLLVLLIAATSSQATTLVRQSLGEQIDRAELIFEGSVVHIETVVTSKTGYPFTLVTFEVDRTYKGERPTTGQLTLRFTGGDTDDIFAYIPSVPRFALGGRHLLFVAGNTKALCPLVGWSQGKLDFRQHPESGAALLVDHDGWPVTGIADDDWMRADQALAADGYWKVHRSAGIVLLGQEGVEVTEVAPQNAARAIDLPLADTVLGDLSARIQAQQKRASYRQPVPVVSATAADVPPTVLNLKGGAR
ncbi:MAG: hypothetical protein AAF481_08810 [Acidobacteriota bacterium]